MVLAYALIANENNHASLFNELSLFCGFEYSVLKDR